MTLLRLLLALVEIYAAIALATFTVAGLVDLALVVWKRSRPPLPVLSVFYIGLLWPVTLLICFAFAMLMLCGVKAPAPRD